MSKAKPTSSDEATPTFEQALERLESIVGTLEKGDMPLSDSLALFEEGVALARRLEGQLGAAEMKIEALLRDARGEELVRPLDPPEAEV